MYLLLTNNSFRHSTKDYVVRISKHPTDDLHREFDHEILKHGFQFFADMINRTVFVFVIVVQGFDRKRHKNYPLIIFDPNKVVILMATIVPAWVSHGKDLNELI